MSLWRTVKRALGLWREPEHLRRGRVGEAAARRHLKRAGLKFLTANFRTKSSEIDLVFRDGDCLVFVEVKARTEGGWTRPAAAVGEAQRCINTSLISRQTVQDDRTIDFRLGATTYRNTLPSPCPRLGSLRSIAYEPLAGQLCANQTVRVIDPIGGGASQGAVCGLGEFVPVEYVDQTKDEMGS